MTRPRKQTVDWFPHSGTHGRTMFILEQRYGIAGYYFWFRLLELLGDTEGHFINLNDPTSFEYLQAHTKTDFSSCKEMLNLLATLQAIDPELWEVFVIWSDNFVKGLAPAYRNRNIVIPVKPDNYLKKPAQPGIKCKLSQKEGEEGKGREGKEKRIAEPGVPPVPALTFYSCKYFEVDFDFRLKLAKEYPALIDEFILKEFSKMDDYIADHPKKYTFRATGHLANPRLFIKKWLDRIQLSGEQLFPGGGPGNGGKREPKGFAGLREWAGEKTGKPEPPDIPL